MSWDPVPWVVGGGVKHTTNVARLLAYLAAEGEEGIVGSLDLQVRQMGTAGPGIRVMPGACCITNRNTSVSYDSYVARCPTEDSAQVVATGSSPRTDLVVARVTNPFLENEPYVRPTEEEIAAEQVQFVETHVMSGISVPSPGTPATRAQALAAIQAAGLSAIPLATLGLPANTSTVLEAQISDLRAIAQFRESTHPRVVKPSANRTITATTFIDIATATVTIPPWATHFSGRALLSGKFDSPGSIGELRLALGTTTGTVVAFNESTDKASDRAVLMAATVEQPIPRTMRGTSVSLTLQGRRTSNKAMVVESSTPVSLDAIFATRPERI